MRIEEWNLLHEMVAESAGHLFTSLGLVNTYAGTIPLSQASWAPTLSIIGLGGKLRGSVVLSVPRALLARSHPTGGTVDDDLGDWLAELTNLTLGGIKSQLLTRGIRTELSTPVMVSATAFRFERFCGAPFVHAFTVGDDTIYVVFEAVAEVGIAFGPTKQPSLSPGVMVTF